MKALVLLAFLFCLGCEMPVGGQVEENQGEEENQEQGFKVYRKWGDEDSEIYISNLDGSGERKLADGYDPALSPDRTQMVYVRLSDLYLMDLETEEETLLLNTATMEGGSINKGAGVPKWHPDGRTIFFDFGSIAHLIDLWAVEKDGTNPRQLIKQGSLASAWPSPFSPDGRKFLYDDCFDECYTLLVFDLDDLERVSGSSSTDSPSRTYLSKSTSYGAWSPDGAHIAFGDVWGPGLFVADSAGAQVREILDNVQVGALSWSSDSRRIAFTQVSDGATGASDGIYEIELDGTDKRSRETHFDRWEHALDSGTVVGDPPSEKTWGQVKAQQLRR